MIKKIDKSNISQYDILTEIKVLSDNTLLYGINDKSINDYIVRIKDLINEL